MAARSAIDQTTADIGREQSAILIYRTCRPSYTQHNRQWIGLALHTGSCIDTYDNFC